MDFSPQNLFKVLEHLIAPNGFSQPQAQSQRPTVTHAPNPITQPLQNPRQAIGSVFTPQSQPIPRITTDQQNYPFLSGLQNNGAGPLVATPDSYVAHNPNYVTPGYLDYGVNDKGQGMYYDMKKKTYLSPISSLPDHSNAMRQFNSNAVVANPAFFSGQSSNNQLIR